MPVASPYKLVYFIAPNAFSQKNYVFVTERITTKTKLVGILVIHVLLGKVAERTYIGCTIV